MEENIKTTELECEVSTEAESKENMWYQAYLREQAKSKRLKEALDKCRHALKALAVLVDCDVMQSNY